MKLSETLTDLQIPYLSTRNLCQDELELFFGKIRLISKNTDARSFASSFAKISSSSLIRAPIEGNCEIDDEQLEKTIDYMHLKNFQPIDDITPFDVDSEELDEALHFSGASDSPIGGVFESVCSLNAASYFSGYIGLKLNKHHRTILKCSINECEGCCDIFTTPDMNLHLFVSFKEYRDNVDSSWGLKYCSAPFIKLIEEYERVFLYFFSKYSHNVGISKTLYLIIKKHCSVPTFCSTLISDYFIKFFIKCRIFQCLRVWNSKLKLPDNRNKYIKASNSK